MRMQHAGEVFKARFQEDPRFFQSPGRINLIGEHIDYNHGIVFPGAINQYITLAIGLRKDQEIHLYSLDYDQFYKTDLKGIKKTEPVWTQFILGVVKQFQEKGEVLQGFNLVFGGNIAQGAGLSSSAALECATAFALKELHGWNYSRLELAKLAQAAENKFVGVNCGLMDQFASLFGKKDSFIQFDCDTLEYQYFPFGSQEYAFLLIDSRVAHSLASSAYNDRRSQCEEGVALIQKDYPEVESLRQVTMPTLSYYRDKMHPEVFKRCAYVVKEMERVQQAGLALNQHDFIQLGKLMYETHTGLSEEYEVSCKELDFMVEQTRSRKDILGARMMGGGFGGCTLNLIKKESLAEEKEWLLAQYETKFKQSLPCYLVELSDGTGEVSTL